MLPDFTSVNFDEEGAAQVAALLLERGVGVEAGVWSAGAAGILLGSGLADGCMRILVEPAEDSGDVRANLAQIEAALERVDRPRLLHGLDASAWELVRLAAERAYGTRIGFEDTLALPDGSVAESNAALVAAAPRRPRHDPGAHRYSAERVP